VKTVNHRFFNTSVKTPSGFDRFEQNLVGVLKEHLARGHVSAFLSLDRGAAPSAEGPTVDLERAREHKQALEAIQAEFALPGVVNLDMLARFPDVFREPDRGSAAEQVEPELVEELAHEAARGVVELRQAEGRRLHDDMAGRLDAMSAELDRVEEQAPQRLESERDRLREAVRELTDQTEVDEDRLAREIAYLAEKWDINEEIVRLRSHLEVFRETLDADESDPAGKRLGFLVQEMHREVNTIGSKANDALIAQAAVAMKEEIERLREQVENVE
jgi:uncharacterized protein (TIGR00255 family)